MPIRTWLSADVCTRAARVAAPAIVLTLAASPVAAQIAAHGGTVKVGFYNIQSGRGEPGLPGRSTPFTDNLNCTDAAQPLNAWGVGFVQQELTASIGSDPSVVALGLAEAWSAVCASPERVRQALGWKGRSDSENGAALIARHGFSGGVTVLQLDTSQSTDAEPRYVIHGRVCTDAACSGTLDVFVTHMAAAGAMRVESMTTQMQQIVAFMAKQAGTRPRVLVGDFNLYEEQEATCGTSVWPASILDNLRNAGYTDAWRALQGSAPGYTGMTNRAGCGRPEGATYKRIDYSWSRDLTPVSVQLFGVVPPGDAAPSDHYGILAEYMPLGSVPPSDATGPDVTLDAPAPGAEVRGAITLSATATDAAGVARVEFFVDGAPAGADSSAPFGVSWNTAALADGPHTVQARALDVFGNSSVSALRSVTVNNGGAPGPGGPTDEIVIHASSAAITGTRWKTADDPAAASGRLLYNANLGASKPSSASAAPVDYAELTFTADAAKAYRLWVRGKAAGNNWGNDSVFVQFSDAVDGSGAPRWRIGSTGATIVQVEQGVNTGLSGWGWSDNGYDAVGAPVYFATGGAHTLRLQIREDGISIDQIVLSAVTYATAAPGLSKDDATILPVQPGAGDPDPGEPPPGDGTGVVTAYDAITDRVARPEPPLPVIGGAGFRFADPTFGSRMLRVTDGRTRPSNPDRSYKTPSASHQNAWNTTSKYFYVVHSGGNLIPFAFDPATMTASRINPTASGDGGLMLDFEYEPQFSYVEEHLIYGAGESVPNTIQQYDFSTHTYTTLLDLKTLGADLSGTVVGGVNSSAGPVEKILAWYGGTGQDRHFRVVVFERKNPSRRRVVDTLASTIDGIPASTLLNFKLHHVEIDKSGRYVMLSPTGTDRKAPRYAAVEYIWDTETDVITPLDHDIDVAGGHKALGYGMMLNKGCCTSSTWDAAQWQIRSLATPTVRRDLIAPVLTPKEVYMSDHVSWNHAQPDRLVPTVTGLYRYGNNTTEWRAWDDEIVAVKTEEGATVVWRFAHHRSDTAGEEDPLNPYFWYMPRLNVSQDGRWAIFTSNWEKTLGVDPTRVEHRQDVFLIELAGASTEPPPVPNGAPTVSLTAPATGAAVPAGSTVTVSAAAADADGTVVRVEFFANGAAIATDTAAPFTTTWQPAAGSYSLTARAVDDDGASTTSAGVSLTAVGPIEIVTASIPEARVGAAYAAAFQAAGGLGSYTWDLSTGSLPAGITLAASGTLSGVPSAAGTWTFTVRARDAADPSRLGLRSFTLVVRAAAGGLAVTITAPANGALVAVGRPLAVTAAPDAAARRVYFFANGTFIGIRTAAPWTIEWTPSFAASIRLVAVAVDAVGTTGWSGPVVVTAIDEVVLYAEDATIVGGGWQPVSDPTAADGSRLRNPNAGAARVSAPAAGPASYIEFTFHAEAGRPYHLWIRGQADSNNWANDSAYVQFSGTVDAGGAAVHRIGTTSGLIYQVEEGIDAKVAGWGWQDTDYGGLAGPIHFEATGPQRIRLQQREDGLSLDQIVISPLTWLETRPGATKNDATIVRR